MWGKIKEEFVKSSDFIFINGRPLAGFKWGKLNSQLLMINRSSGRWV